MKIGCDMSQWQGNVNFEKMKAAGIRFLLLRDGYRRTMDPMLNAYVTGAKAAGIPILGLYHFLYLNGATIEQNANSAVANAEAVGLDPAEVWMYLDIEYDTWNQLGRSATKKECTEIALRYIHELERLGCKKIGLYLNNDYFLNYFDWGGELGKYKTSGLWFADPSHGYGATYQPCAIHQYTDKGRVDGVNGTVDMNYLYDESMLEDQSVDFAQDQDDQETVNVNVVESAVKQMESWAADNSHGYDQRYRWGEKGDYDCSSAVFQAWQNAGIPVKDYAFAYNGVAYTGNMKSTFTACGFEDITHEVNLATGSGLIRGDVLLNHVHHVAMYCGSGKEVEASINEFGGVTGGAPGDQTGREFLVKPYANYPWNCVLRYPEKDRVITVTQGKPGTSNCLFKAASEKIFTVSGTGTPNKTERAVGKCVADVLNVRTWAGTGNNRIKAYPELRYGNLVSICDSIQDSKGDTWYYIKIAGKWFGFVHSDFIE